MMERMKLMMGWWKVQGFGKGLSLVLSFMIGCFLILHLCFGFTEIGSNESNRLRILVQTVVSDGTRNLGLLLAASIGWYFLLQRIEAAKQSAKAAEQSAKAAEQSVLIERLTRAMEQLASDQSSTRMVGIFSLNKIAENHREESEEIVRILSTRICELAPLRNNVSFSNRNERLDIEAAVIALADIAVGFEDYKQHLCDLRNTDLSSLKFYGIDLSHFVFTGVNFTNAGLFGIDFTETKLEGVNFSNTKLDVYGLTQEQVRGAFCWRGQPPVYWPDELKPLLEREKPKDDGE